MGMKSSKSYLTNLSPTQAIRLVGKEGAFPDLSPRLGVIYARQEFKTTRGPTLDEVVPVVNEEGGELMILRWRSGFVDAQTGKRDEIDLIYTPDDERYMVFSEVVGTGTSWTTLKQALSEFEDLMHLAEPINLEALYELVDIEQYEVGTRDLPNESDALSVQSRAELYRETESFGRWS